VSGAPPINTNKRKVLVVEDDPTIATLLNKTLERVYQVSVVNDGPSAVRKAVMMRPHLVLLDVNLPGLDGFAVAKRIKEDANLKGVPIIFLTAQDSPGDMIKGIQVGARNYLTKPFRIEDLMKKVEKALS
jgi:DNA-binding response OmpR family regulator